MTHAELMDGYYCLREHEEMQAEAITFGYDTELAEYWEANPRTTFREYLIQMRGR